MRKRRKKLASEASRGGGLGEAIARGQALHFEWRAKPAARERTSEERQGRRPSPFPLSSPPLGSPGSTGFSLFHPALSLFSRATKPGPKLLEEMQLNPKEGRITLRCCLQVLKFSPNLATKYFEMSELG